MQGCLYKEIYYNYLEKNEQLRSIAHDKIPLHVIVNKAHLCNDEILRTMVREVGLSRCILVLLNKCFRKESSENQNHTYLVLDVSLQV